MSSSAPDPWLEAAATQPDFARRLAAIRPGAGPVVFDHVDPAARAWLVALIVRRGFSRVWVLDHAPKSRDRLAVELRLWNCRAHILPDPPVILEGEDSADPETDALRLGVLDELAQSDAALVLTSPEAFAHPAPAPQALVTGRLRLEPGAELDLTKSIAMLAEAGFERTTLVQGRGQFAVRGGILDVFPWHAARPLRIELFGDEIDSIREFDLDSQVSIQKRGCMEMALADPERDDRVESYRRPGDLLIEWTEDPSQSRADVILTPGPADPQGEEDFSTACLAHPFGHFEAGDFILGESRRAEFIRQLADWHAASWQVALVFANRGELGRFLEFLPTAAEGHFTPLFGELIESFTVPSARLAVISSSELLGRYRSVAPPGSNKSRAAALTSLDEIAPGDLVVHSEYGIARFTGTRVAPDGSENLILQYRDGASLAVPIEQAHLVGRYIGIGGKPPQLSKLGGSGWKTTRGRAAETILDYAARLLRLQAERQTEAAYAHPPDSRWMWEFEQSFRFTETPDQLRAIADAKRDMESHKPMDRLICGDVGFGKTEVAIRAAFKSVTGGKQVVVLCPTTVLAEQHWQTFRERMSEYPVRIDLLNRFRSAAETRATIAGLASGAVDIVIGTHRLLSSDIAFKDLGLAVIDEEQRFGVQHKERFKELFHQIDVLTLSATPIPRTLYMALMGARDMSTIDTPPPNRIPVQTTVAAYDERLIRAAIERELARGGQVFFLHNRVRTIESVRKRLQALVPAARILVGHGQMEKDELEVVMRSFVKGEADILLATTIIESGIDIPNANTILIDRADRFGLADLYQLRGRVGRAGRQAHAILLLPRDLATVGAARKRIHAIKQYTALGSGFRIAMRDLEIRGAGNLLGTRQSGQIAAIGFDLYCQLLRQSIERLRGRPSLHRHDSSFKADFLVTREVDWGKQEPRGCLPAYLPTAWLDDSGLRVATYRELASVSSEAELDILAKNWADRFGPLPDPVSNLLQITRLRLVSAAAGVASVEISGQRLMIHRNGNYIVLENARFPRLEALTPDAKLRETLGLLRTL